MRRGGETALNMETYPHSSDQPLISWPQVGFWEVEVVLSGSSVNRLCSAAAIAPGSSMGICLAQDGAIPEAYAASS